MKDGSFETAPERIRFGLLDVGTQRIGIDIGVLLEVCMIKELAPVMIGKPELMGVVNLRGSMIPVLDPSVLCKLPTGAARPQIAAVLGKNGRSIALGVDRISGLSEIARSDIQFLIHDDETRCAVSGGFYVDGAAVNLIDTDFILGTAGVPSSTAPLRAPRKGMANGATAFLTFQSGGATFGLDAVRIFGTVPGQVIAQDSLSGGACLGTIKHHRRRVPVMDANQVFGLGERRDRQAPEIVVMRFPEDRLLGFAVDTIRRIQLIKKADLRSTKSVFGSGRSCFSSVLTDASGNQTFILDADVLEQTQDLRTIAGLSDPPVSDEVDQTTALGGPQDVRGQSVTHEALRYLVFTAGQQMAAPIEQLVQILEPPRTLTPVPDAGPHVLGLFTIDGAVVPLISMGRLMSLGGEADTRNNRVLLVGPPERRVGFLVSRVDGIEMSSWRVTSDEIRHSDGLVHFRSDSVKTVIPRLHLEAIAAGLEI